VWFSAFVIALASPASARAASIHPSARL
jgi:hypothetical protein